MDGEQAEKEKLPEPLSDASLIALLWCGMKAGGLYAMLDEDLREHPSLKPWSDAAKTHFLTHYAEAEAAMEARRKGKLTENP